MIRILKLIILLFLTTLTTFAQQPKTFVSGEKVVFDAYYNWGFIWLHAGQAMFTARDTVFNGDEAYLMKATGTTFKGYDYLFKVRDTLISVVSKDSLQPIWFTRKTNEGTYSAELTYHFDHAANMVTGTKKRHEKTEYASYILPENTRDIVSVIYYLREVDLTGMKEDDRILFNMVVDNEMWELYVRYLGKKVVKLKSGRKFRCIVLAPLLLEGSVFSGGEGMKIFVTDDRNRLPVYIESKVLVGKVKASLESYENLKFPLSSEVY
ncbi:DUF3108 domain-containing protein [Saccharicrinis sp. FJH54]|uniref:DUF3108 domain-containing protein n=1 Tax=Saccharicrinis sp. FJH54 TaxID=3344665 RepID=UPI0035D435F1